MMLLAGIIFGFAFLRLMIAGVNIGSRFRTDKDLMIKEDVSLAVLIPARNEELNIGGLLDNLCHQSLKPDEVVVYDDHSNDQTSVVVKQYMEKMPVLRLIKGVDLPKGWLGKNHACHQLSSHTQADLLVFLDADVRISPDFLRMVRANLLNKQLKLFSIFPQQLMETIGEKLVVPLMNWILLSLLPMPLIRISSRASLAAANGQFMMFDGKTYRQHLYHRKFRNQPVEDIWICKYMKMQNYRVETLISGGEIQCRMYKNGKDALNGFQKNVFAFFGNSTLLAVLFMLVTSFGWLFIGFALGFQYMLVYLMVAVLIRSLVFHISKQNALLNVYQPVQQLVFSWLIIKAWLSIRKKKLIWKGRNIYE